MFCFWRYWYFFVTKRFLTLLSLDLCKIKSKKKNSSYILNVSHMFEETHTFKENRDTCLKKHRHTHLKNTETHTFKKHRNTHLNNAETHTFKKRRHIHLKNAQTHISKKHRHTHLKNSQTHVFICIYLTPLYELDVTKRQFFEAEYNSF